MPKFIPFNRPHITGNELSNIQEAHELNQLAGNGAFTKRCQKWIEQNTHGQKALLTHSCTAALEMCALLLQLEPGDEVIMPSYTFVSTANAFVLQGATPVFVDIRPDTLNIDETLIEEAITERTKGLVVVHYAGVSCDMDAINTIAKRHNIPVIEDAAQAVMSRYKGKALGGIGDLGCFSFHETKNVISGEGGALIVNNPRFSELAEIHWEKGTDRSRFFRGEVDKYTWQAVGSSYLPGELIAAFLWAQLEEADKITKARLDSWDRYYTGLANAEQKGLLRRPIVPDDCEHNAHMFYILLPEERDRSRIIRQLKVLNVNTVFHYSPLHSSPQGKRCARAHGQLTVTERVSKCILRLPLWVGISASDQDHVVDALTSTLS